MEREIQRLYPLVEKEPLAYQESYTDAIDKLMFACERYMEAGGFGGIVAWPIFINNRFATFLREKQTLALLVVAHWALCLHLIRDRWWAKNAGKRFVENLLQEEPQDPRWENFLPSVALLVGVTRDRA